MQMKSEPDEHLARAALYMTLSALLFSGMGAIVKFTSAHLPTEMVVFFRAAMGLVALMPWVLRDGWSLLRTTQLPMHLTRSLAGLAAMYCFFYAIAHLKLADATLLNYSTPLFIPFIAWFWMRESVSPPVRVAIALGFVGVALILKPGYALFHPAALIGLASGLLAAIAMVSIRRLSRTEPVTRIVFYFTLVSTVVSAVPLIWTWAPPGTEAFVLLTVMGMLATGAQLLMTRAYAHAPAAHVGPFSYLAVVFAAIIGWVLWEETPDIWSFAGAILVCLAGVWTIVQSQRRGPVAPDA